MTHVLLFFIFSYTSLFLYHLDNSRHHYQRGVANKASPTHLNASVAIQKVPAMISGWSRHVTGGSCSLLPWTIDRHRSGQVVYVYPAAIGSLWGEGKMYTIN